MNRFSSPSLQATAVSLHRRAGALLALATLLVAGLMLSACNTTAGAGHDVKATGAAITRGADDVKGKL